MKISTTMSVSGSTIHQRVHFRDRARLRSRIGAAPKELACRASLAEADIERALSGDRMAARRLHDELRPSIESAVRRLLWTPGGLLCRGEVEAADLVQEMFMSLWSKQGRVLRMWREDGGMSLRGFVYRHVWNRTRSVLRMYLHRRLFMRVLAEEDLHAIASDEDLGARVADRDQVSGLLARLQRHYGPRETQMLLRYLVDGLTAAEVRDLYPDLADTAIYQRASRFYRRARKMGLLEVGG